MKTHLHTSPIVVKILTAASRFAGDSSFGSANIEMTLTRIVSTVCIGSQRSSGRS